MFEVFSKHGVVEEVVIPPKLNKFGKIFGFARFIEVEDSRRRRESEVAGSGGVKKNEASRLLGVTNRKKVFDKGTLMGNMSFAEVVGSKRAQSRVFIQHPNSFQDGRVFLHQSHTFKSKLVPLGRDGRGRYKGPYQRRIKLTGDSHAPMRIAVRNGESKMEWASSYSDSSREGDSIDDIEDWLSENSPHNSPGGICVVAETEEGEILEQVSDAFWNIEKGDQKRLGRAKSNSGPVTFDEVLEVAKVTKAVSAVDGKMPKKKGTVDILKKTKPAKFEELSLVAENPSHSFKSRGYVVYPEFSIRDILSGGSVLCCRSTSSSDVCKGNFRFWVGWEGRDSNVGDRLWCAINNLGIVRVDNNKDDLKKIQYMEAADKEKFLAQSLWSKDKVGWFSVASIGRSGGICLIQETKLKAIDESIVRSLWSKDKVGWFSVASIGRSGGIFLIQETKLKAIDESIVRSLWSKDKVGWFSVASIGRS
ncbi:unnamed protein product [Vicia faba]|uniref:RRM domain-containing protein n=1 Tax=Vicia faba TaxID=3906 RepID=A0AAV0Z8F9_VICFA|nr:unnamed protein product [Vicia faba]